MCINYTHKISFLWIYCVAVFNSQLNLVLAGQETFGPKSIEDWREITHGSGAGEYWSVYKNPERFYTQMKQGGQSWVITKEFRQANFAYINITALPVECSGKKICDLNIYGNKTTISSVPVQPNRRFITDNFELIKTVSFTQNTRGEISVMMKKAYNRLCIVTTLTKTKTTWNIYSMKLYYNFCDQDGIDKISIPNTNSSDGDISVTGNCLINSILIGGNTTITAKCSSQGEWTVDNDQKCLCNKGFGLGSSKSCSRCLINYYKAKIADAECVKCPEGRTNNTMNTKCQCLKDHYIVEDENGPCYAVPPKVKDLEIKTHDTFVSVSWQKPLYGGGLNDSLTYGVVCYHCNQSNCDKEVENATFKPGKTNLTTTYMNIFNLVKKAKYKLRVVSRNSLNLPNDRWKYAEKNFTFVPTPGLTESTSRLRTGAATTKPTIVPDSSKESKDDNNMFIYISAGAAFLVFVLLIIIIVICIKLLRAKTHKDCADNRGFHSTEFDDVHKRTLKTENGGVVEVVAKTLKEPYYENPDELEIELQGTKPHKEVPILIRSVLAADEKRPDETDPTRNALISEPSAYTKLNENARNGRDIENVGNYQKLLKRDSDYVIPANGETDSTQNEQSIELSPYAQLDRNKKEEKDTGIYQQLLRSDPDNKMANDS